MSGTDHGLSKLLTATPVSWSVPTRTPHLRHRAAHGRRPEPHQVQRPAHRAALRPRRAPDHGAPGLLRHPRPGLAAPDGGPAAPRRRAADAPAPGSRSSASAPPSPGASRSPPSSTSRVHCCAGCAWPSSAPPTPPSFPRRRPGRTRDPMPAPHEGRRPPPGRHPARAERALRAVQIGHQRRRRRTRPDARRASRRRYGPVTTLWRTVLSALQNPDAPGRKETIARGAAALALKRSPEATVEDALEIGLYEFGRHRAAHRSGRSDRPAGGLDRTGLAIRQPPQRRPAPMTSGVSRSAHQQDHV